MKIAATLKAFGITFALAVCASMASATKATRGWNKYPPVLQLNTNEDVFAISDVHGDPDRLAEVLLAAKLIATLPSAPDQVKWAGDKSVLVITGDLIDKWNKSLQVIALLRALQRDAASHGGRVIILMGNHEAEFLAKPDGDKTSTFYTRNWKTTDKILLM
jgi:predicted MPP superfamily phosphohydrolase